MNTDDIKNQIDSLLSQIEKLRVQLADDKSPTAVNLKNQIDALLAQIETLDVQLKVGNPPMAALGLTPEQTRYNDAIMRATSSGYTYLNSKEPELIIDFERKNLIADTEKSLLEINEIGIELIDREKIREGWATVNLEYEEEFKAGKVGGIGTGGGFLGFTVNAIATFIFYWIAGHVSEDLDDLLWGKFKKVFLSVFSSAKKTDKNDQLVIVASRNPQIIFVFPLKLSSEIVAEELNGIVKLTKENAKADKNLAYKFTYDGEMRAWGLEKTRGGML